MSEEWSNGKIIWITPRPGPEGSTSWEVIYELEDDPENLKQILLPQAGLYPDAKKGDRMRIKTTDPPAIEPRS